MTVADAIWREAARRVLGTYGERQAIDMRGLSVPQAALVSRLTGGEFELVGTVTNVCHTCGVLITRPWETLFVDVTPGREWASEFEPPTIAPGVTTHHVWHLSS